MRYFWWPTGELAGTKHKLATNAVLALDCLDLTHTDRQIASPET